MYNKVTAIMGLWSFLCVIGFVVMFFYALNDEYVLFFTKSVSGGYYYLPESTRISLKITAIIGAFLFWLDLWFKPVLVMGVIAILCKPEWKIKKEEN